MKGNEHYCINLATHVTGLKLDPNDVTGSALKLQTLPLNRAICAQHLISLEAEGDYQAISRLHGTHMIGCNWGK